MPSGIDRETWKRNRASRGGHAGAATNQTYPLRQIVGADRDGREHLECGHWIWPPQDLAGDYPATRRRCKLCPPKEVPA